MAVDQRGDLIEDNNGSWGAGTAIGDGSALTSISCPSTDFCAAVGANGEATIFGGGTWEGTTLNDPVSSPVNLDAVSCPEVGFCLAIASGGSFEYSDGKWSGENLVSTVDGNSLQVLSCASSSACVAGDNGGSMYNWTPSGWNAVSGFSMGSGVAGVSCPGPTFCAGVDQDGDGYVAVQGTWSTTSLIAADGNRANPTALDCSGVGDCFATGDWDVYQLTGTTWLNGVLVEQNEDADFTSIDCPTARWCVAVDDNGNAFIGQG
jgi:hypothetical protein